MMRATKTFVLLSCLLVFGCAQKTSQEGRVTTPPKQTESARRDISDASKQGIVASEQNKQASGKIKDQSETIWRQKTLIDAAISEAERLKEKIAANEAIKEIEMADLISSFVEIRGENKLLSDKNKELAEINKNQFKTLESANAALKKIQDKYAENEKELATLRLQKADDNNEIVRLNKENKNLEERNIKLAEQAADAKVYKKIIWAIGIGYVLMTILRNVLMAYGVRMRI